jgi:UDP-3-O-[3-hydroxymyristoyl] glucosamine N-acyltransferase
MTQGTFFKRPSPVTLADLAVLTGAQLADPSHAGKMIAEQRRSTGPDRPSDISDQEIHAQLEQTHAGACLVNERMEGSVPPHVAVLRVAEPYRAFVTAMRSLYPDTLRPASWFDNAAFRQAP